MQKMYFLSTLSLLFVLTVKQLSAQNYLSNFERTLTPSPMVASLGTFGGTDVKKNTGGIQKSIPLFEIKQGDINYNPTLEYFSTGIRVDDWGSRIGIVNIPTAYPADLKYNYIRTWEPSLPISDDASITSYKSGQNIQNIIQKSGRQSFMYTIDKMADVGNSYPYVPTPVEGTTTPYYNKTKK